MNCKKILAISLAIMISSSVCSSTVLAWSDNTWKKVVDNGNGQGTGHKSMILKMSADIFTSPRGKEEDDDENRKNHRDIVAEAASLTDKLETMKSSADTTDKILSPYHAKTAYSLDDVTNKHAKFLYELARRRLVAGSKLELDSSKYEGDTYHGANIGLATKRRIIDDLRILNNELVKKGYDMSDVDHQGYMVLGVYLHLIEDIYCHKATFTQERVKDIKAKYIIGNGTSKEKVKWLKDKIGAGIPITRLNDYLKKELSVKIDSQADKIECTPHMAYEDNPFYWSSRYTAAYSATEEQLLAIMNDEDFTFTTYSDVPLFTEALGKDSKNGGDDLLENEDGAESLDGGLEE